MARTGHSNRCQRPGSLALSPAPGCANSHKPFNSSELHFISLSKSESNTTRVEKEADLNVPTKVQYAMQESSHELAILQQKTQLPAPGRLCGEAIPGTGGGIILSRCPCSDPERQLPTASLGASGTYVWVGLSWQDSHTHNCALVCHYEHFISSCQAARWGLAEEGQASTSGLGWVG